MKKYGLPYKGSKSTIADQLINVMPEAEYFVDLFCGGCAMTHAAMLTAIIDLASIDYLYLSEAKT